DPKDLPGGARPLFGRRPDAQADADRIRLSNRRRPQEPEGMVRAGQAGPGRPRGSADPGHPGRAFPPSHPRFDRPGDPGEIPCAAAPRRDAPDSVKRGAHHRPNFCFARRAKGRMRSPILALQLLLAACTASGTQSAAVPSPAPPLPSLNSGAHGDLILEGGGLASQAVTEAIVSRLPPGGTLCVIKTALNGDPSSRSRFGAGLGYRVVVL